MLYFDIKFAKKLLEEIMNNPTDRLTDGTKLIL